MPIPRRLRHLYRTPEARAANAAVRARAEGRCEATDELLGVEFRGGRCNAPNGQLVARHADDPWVWTPEPMVASTSWRRPVKVVLTVAHLDHDPKNNDLSNLRALCQWCHLTHDREQHQATRKTRPLRVAVEHGQELLFPGRFPDLVEAGK